MLSSSNTLHVLGKPWAMPHFIKPLKGSRLPDIVTVEEVQTLFATSSVLFRTPAVTAIARTAST